MAESFNPTPLIQFNFFSSRFINKVVLSNLRRKIYFKMCKFSVFYLLLSAAVMHIGYALKEGECEVCIKTVEKFAATLSDDVKKDTKLIEAEFRKFCKGTKNKENRFCYYLGGLEESATGILGELSKPLSWSMPADKICEKLRKKDAQVCDLRFDKQIDLKNVDLKKLKVRDLKKILNDWDEVCDGCIEKTDFIKRIEELKPKYMGRSEL